MFDFAVCWRLFEKCLEHVLHFMVSSCFVPVLWCKLAVFGRVKQLRPLGLFQRPGECVEERETDATDLEECGLGCKGEGRVS